MVTWGDGLGRPDPAARTLTVLEEQLHAGRGQPALRGLQEEVGHDFLVVFHVPACPGGVPLAAGACAEARATDAAPAPSPGWGCPPQGQAGRGEGRAPRGSL